MHSLYPISHFRPGHPREEAFRRPTGSGHGGSPSPPCG
ncbi:hypothetical protein STVIR_7375 [Streptomyces viridochromogenes Tue57]|uniref:Uncharacterized protein n=1 Tax=Streptomyces viridochromogenes Tue57 TaxID=1160705 RepID=L8P5J7_STRVR|nr:hypothetical protein STVIR_7375 [Streptomyces viridochromogenes Tue57]